MGNLTQEAKNRWEMLPSKVQKSLVGVLVVIVIVGFLMLAAGKEKKRSQSVLDEKTPLTQTDLLGLTDENGDIETLSSEVRTIKDQQAQILLDNKKTRDQLFALDVQVKKAIEVNGDPEVLLRLASELNDLKKDVKENDGRYKEMLLNGTPGVTAGATTGGGEIVGIIEEGENSGDGSFDIFGDSDDPAGIDSNNQLDVIAGHRASKVGRADARNALIATAEEGQATDEFEDEEAGGLGIFITDEPEKKTSTAERINSRAVSSKRSNIDRDLVGEEKQPKNPAVYIPSGSMLTAFMINGIDAPTGESAKSHPVPVTLRINSQIIMPNHYQFDARECFLTGAAYGNASSERAEIRTERISCVWGDDEFVDFPIEGYITGEDGKVGLRGTLVTKQGKLLYNSAMSGLLSGFSKAFQPQRINSVQTGGSAGGVEYEAPPADAVLGNGLQQGVSTSAEKIADFYLEKAEQLFPIIEVDAMREVTVIINKGVRLEASDLTKAKVSRTKVKRKGG